jgi:hypothetical protein
MTAERNGKEGRTLYDEFIQHARTGTDVDERETHIPEVKQPDPEQKKPKLIHPQHIEPRTQETIIFKPVRRVEKPQIEIPQVTGNDAADPAKARKPQKPSRFTEWVRKITDMLY